MRKYLLFIAILVIVLQASASRFQQHEISIELGSPSFVNVTVEVEKLTSEKFTYLTPYLSVLFRSLEDGKPISCESRILDVGTQFVCSPEEIENFTITLSYTTNQLIQVFLGAQFASFSYPVLEPIGVQRVNLILPEGTGLLQNNSIPTPHTNF